MLKYDERSAAITLGNTKVSSDRYRPAGPVTGKKLPIGYGQCLDLVQLGSCSELLGRAPHRVGCRSIGALPVGGC